MRWLLMLCASCRINFDPIGDGDVVGPDEVEIVIEGHGAALVEGQRPCATRCRYATGPLTVRAFAGEAWQFDRFSTCGAQPTCVAELGTSVTVSFTRAPITGNLIFVSSMPAPLTGIDAIDTFCRQRASTAGLAGNFLAFLSTSNGDAITRIAGARGFVRVDGLPVFNDPIDLPNPARPRGVVLDELGGVHDKFVMTGSNGNGMRTTNHCSNYTSTTGAITGGRSAKTGIGTLGNSAGNCIDPAPVYCVAIDADVVQPLPPPSFPAGRVIFVTRQLWSVGGGIDSADALCAADAASAGAPGTYRALLATSTETAAQRVGGIGGVWRRLDGVVVAWDGLDQPVLEAGIVTDWSGVVDASLRFFGARSLHIVGAWNCADWTDPAGSLCDTLDTLNLMSFTDPVGIGTCSVQLPVLCAQLPES